MAIVTFEAPAGLKIQVEGSERTADMYAGDTCVVEYPGVIVLLVDRCDRMESMRVHFDIDPRFIVVYDGAAQESRPLDQKGRCLMAISQPGNYVLTISDPNQQNGGYV